MREAIRELLSRKLTNSEVRIHHKLDSVAIKQTSPSMVIYNISEMKDAIVPITLNSKIPLVILYRDFKHAVLAKQMHQVESSLISQDAPVEDLIKCIESLTLQRSFYCDITLQNTLDQLSSRRKSITNPATGRTMQNVTSELLYHKLSNRQQEIIQLIFQGKSTSQIAAVLNLKLSTISTIKSQILKKMQVSNIIELVKTYNVIPE